MHLFVTGATGLVGRALTHALLDAPHAPRVTTTARAPFPAPPAPPAPRPAHAHLRLDLAREADVDALAARIRADLPSHVVHAAAMSSLDDCEREPERAAWLNAEVPERLARAAADAGARFVFLSSDYVFGDREGPHDEASPPAPLGVYATSKARAERAVLGLDSDALVVRVASVFAGAPERHAARATFAFDVYTRLRAGETVDAFSDQWITPTYLGDLTRMLLGATTHAHRGLLHCACTDEVTRLAFCRKIADLAGAPRDRVRALPMAEARLAAKRPRRSSLDSGLGARILGENGPRTLTHGLRAFAMDLQLPLA